MSIPADIANLGFAGPYPVDTDFGDYGWGGAVYVISDEEYNLIDVGQTGDIGKRLDDHERKGCWEDNANGEIYVYILPEDYKEVRLDIERKIRNNHCFPCGER